MLYDYYFAMHLNWDEWATQKYGADGLNDQKVKDDKMWEKVIPSKSCERIMCKMEICNPRDYRRYAMKQHSDKTGKPHTFDFLEAQRCKNRDGGKVKAQYCTKKSVCPQGQQKT